MQWSPSPELDVASIVSRFVVENWRAYRGYEQELSSLLNRVDGLRIEGLALSDSLGG
jgi:hypothetical protein